MGGANSGRGDTDVSGAEAVATGGTTYSSRQTKKVNKLIESRNRSPREKIANFLKKTPVGSIVTKVADTNNYKRRIKYAEINGFNVRDKSKSFVLSDSFKTQLDARGYDDYNKGLMGGNVGNQDNDRGNNNQTVLDNNANAQANLTQPIVSPTNAEVAQAQSTTMSADEILLANKKKGRAETIMTSASGLGSSNILNTKKKTLGV